MTTNAKDFYLAVVNEVIEKNRQQFISEGVSEDVLEKLRKIWEEKINQKLTPEAEPKFHHDFHGGQDPNYSAGRSGAYPSYWNPQYYQYQQMMQHHYQQQQMMRGFNMQGMPPVGFGQPGSSAFHPPQQAVVSQLGKREEPMIQPGINRESNDLGDQSRKLKRPRTGNNNDGLSDDEEDEEGDEEDDDEEEEEDPDEALFRQQTAQNNDQQVKTENISQTHIATSAHVHQEIVVNQSRTVLYEERSLVADRRQPYQGDEEEKQSGAPNAPLFRTELQQREMDQQQEDSDEDDDDDEEDMRQQDCKNYIAAQYEKVQRTKQKYKCIFKDAIIHLNGKDFVVKKFTADIEY